MKTIKYILVASTALLLSSCHIYQKYELPENNGIIDHYKNAVESNDSTSLGYIGWEQVFTDPMLQNYIQQALENNTNLENARLNVDMANAQLKGAKLSYLPSVALTPNGGTASYGGSHMNWSYSIPVAVSWEIDVFGKILNRKRKAKVDVEQAEDYLHATRSQIVCAVANTYYALVWLNLQLDLSKSTAAVWKEQVESMRLLKEAGQVTEAAVVQSSANYNNIMSNIPDIENSINELQNTMSLLLNTYPQQWQVSSNLDISLPAGVSNGVPFYYLATRPDVRAAERSFASAYYATNMARTNFYPSLSISAQGGFTNLVGSIITNPGKWFIQLAGQLTAPLFSRGANIAQLDAAKAQQEVALNNFEYSVLSAAADVSDAMSSMSRNDEKLKWVTQQINDLEKSVEYTGELLTYGKSTYLEVLTARSGLLQAQLAELTAKHEKAAALISLYQAVGGGR